MRSSERQQVRVHILDRVGSDEDTRAQGCVGHFIAEGVEFS
jgi:hypothetical protein